MRNDRKAMMVCIDHKLIDFELILTNQL